MLVGATGKTVCVWDALNSKVPTISIKEAHQDDINDAKFSSLNPNLIGTASSDSHFKLWDIRTPKQFTQCQKASEDELLVISFSHFSEYLFATGGEDSGNLHVWDIRLPRSSLNDFIYHKKQVTSIEWNPQVENLFLSSSMDGQVFIWDHGKTGEEQARHDYQDGPPELIFPHEMHQGKVIDDACWCPHKDQERMVVSVDVSFQFQAWQATREVFASDSEYTERIG